MSNSSPEMGKCLPQYLRKPVNFKKSLNGIKNAFPYSKVI